MKYGKIRIEDGYLVFTKHMRMNSLPCRDIIWAYARREGTENGDVRRLITNYLVVLTKRKKRYKFDMTEREVQDCIGLLKMLNPDIAVGFPKGVRIPLLSLPNTRDLGAITTADGRHILPRKLIRSGDLYHVSLADQQVLTKEYNLKTVIDFRTSTERAEKPDTVMEGVTYLHNPILDEETMGISRESGLSDLLLHFSGDADKYLEQQYVNFIHDPFCVKQYARFLDAVLENQDGAVLWHCTAGKDRVGVGTALLLYALGVPMKTIREDFMRTNLYVEEELMCILRLLEAQGADQVHIVENLSVFFKVKETYLDIVFQTIEKEYGSVEHFLRRALYLTPKAIEELKRKYLI